MSQLSPFVAGALVAGRYRLLRRLGQGAMGAVWAARNVQTNGDVALKLLIRSDPELRPRLVREAHASCQVRHKNVIQVQDVGQTDDGDPFLVMELLSGENLAELLERKRRLNQEDAATIGRDVARAVAAAHDKGIIHRDLKPANVFLHNQPGEDARVVKVLDFGVSKNLLISDGLRTVVGSPIGSPLYMSPEQACARPDVDGRADIWSLGILLFEMLTGERPFEGDATEVIKKILNAEIPVVSRRVRGVDPELERLIAACLCREREHRPWPTSEVASMLDAFVRRSGRAPFTTPAEPSVQREDAALRAPASSTERLSPGHLGAAANEPYPSDSSSNDGEDAATRKLQIGMLADVAPRLSPSRDVEHGKVEPPALLSTPTATAESPHGAQASRSRGGDLKGLAQTVRITPNEALQFNPSEARGTQVTSPGAASPVPALMSVEAAKAPAGPNPPSFAVAVFGDRMQMKTIALVAGGSVVAASVTLVLLLKTPSKAESATAGEAATASIAPIAPTATALIAPTAPTATGPSVVAEPPAEPAPGATASATGRDAPSAAPVNDRAMRPGPTPAPVRRQPPIVRKHAPPPAPCPKSTFGVKKGCRG